MNHYKYRIRGHTRLGGGQQRGVALIFTAFILLALVAATGLAIDVGRLYAAQQNLQTAANIAAIEAARVVSGCESGVPSNPLTAAQDAVKHSIERNYANRTDGGIPTADVRLGAAQSLFNETTGERTGIRVFQVNGVLPPPSTPGQSLDNSAVQVILTDPDSPNLFPIFPSTILRATASARNIPTATFQLGSSLLKLDNVLLGSLGIDTGVFDQGSLADANLTLGALATELGVATPEALLTTNLPLQNLIEGVNSVSGNALAGLGDALDADLANTNVSLGDVLVSVGPLGETAQINAQAIAGALLQAAMANRQTPISLPLDVNLNVAGLVSANVIARIRILEPPKIVVGRPGLDANGDPRTQARSAQIAIQLDTNLKVDLLGLATLEGDLPIFIDTGTASAQLQNIFCANSQKLFHEVAITAQAGTARLGIGRFDNLNSPAPNPVEGGLLSFRAVGLKLLGVSAAAGPISLGSGGSTTMPLRDGMGRLFQDPPKPDDDNTREIVPGLQPGSAISDLLGTLDVQLQGSLGLLNLLLGPAVKLLAPTVGNLLGALALDDTLNNLLTGLGVNLGTATVILDGVDVDQPELFQATSGDASASGSGGNPSGGGGANSGAGGAAAGGST